MILTDDGKDAVNEICVDELSSDVVNDSIYNRERFVEDRLNVEIENARSGDLEAEVIKQQSADEDTFQIYAYMTFAFTRFVFDNYFHDLYSLDNLSLDKPWWSSNFNSEAEINGDLYVTTGSLALTLTRYMYAVFYNKKLAEEYTGSSDGKYAELAELYKLVDDGKWTIDKLIELSEDVYQGLNGNQERDVEDIYGMGFQNGISVDTIWSSFDLDILKPNEDGWFDFNVNKDKLFSSMEKIYNYIYNTTGCYPAGIEDEKLNSLRDHFASDTRLFMVNKLLAIEGSTLRNMQSDYGILPFPKYDEKQSKYYSYSHDAYTSFAIPKTCGNPDEVAAVLEALASYAYRDTEPAYLDVALKGKYMSDANSRRMIDLVVDGFMVDAAWIYLETLSESYPHAFRQLIVNQQTSYASTHETQKKKLERSLKVYEMKFNSVFK